MVYQAAQIKASDHGFLSSDITVRDLLLNRCDVHHVYPKNHLKGEGLSRSQYNQIANFVLAQSEINIAIGDRAPAIYFSELDAQCSSGKKRYGGITSLEALKSNMAANCLPVSLLGDEVPAYEEFLAERRVLMAAKIKQYFKAL